jgi:hypothetical protein
MEVRSRACPGEVEEAAAALAGQVISMTSTVKYFQFLASGGRVCWAARASSDDTAGGSRSGGGTRRTAPSIPTRLASWVFLCLYMAQQPNPLEAAVSFWNLKEPDPLPHEAQLNMTSKLNVPFRDLGVAWFCECWHLSLPVY